MIPSSGVKFRKMRSALGVTQAEIALLFGVSEQSVGRWERQESRLDRSAAVLLWLLFDEKINQNKHAVRDYLALFSAVRK